MRKRLGALCMIVGALLLLSALVLLVFNNAQSNRAQQSSEKVVSYLKDVIPDSDDQTALPHPEPDISTAERQMDEVEVYDYNYIGYLSIPSQGLELPVMSQWDYSRLRIAPCRYSGSIADGNLVVIAHNYRSHFGHLDQLKPEDNVLFINTKGVVTTYQVASFDVVPPTSASEVVAGDFDLALVTCTYSGKTRFVVYCDEVMAK